MISSNKRQLARRKSRVKKEYSRKLKKIRNGRYSKFKSIDELRKHLEG
jgi:hypothetical protein